MQNELAELRKRLEADAATKYADTINGKEIEMPKKVEGWKKGEGSFSNSDLNLKREPVPPFSPGRDISKKVDANHAKNDGFSGPLESKE